MENFILDKCIFFFKSQPTSNNNYETSAEPNEYIFVHHIYKI